MNRRDRKILGCMALLVCMVNVQAKTIFIAPEGEGNTSNSSYQHPVAFPTIAKSKLLDILAAGDTAYFLGGQYDLSQQYEIKGKNNGTAGKRIFIGSYPGEIAVFDFRKQAYIENNDNESNIGLKVSKDVNYLHLKGIVARYAGKNGIRIEGSNNLIEACTAYENCNSGIQLKKGGNNKIVNCDSFSNFDYKTMNKGEPDYGGDADGFADKQYTSSKGNTYIGCRSWNNSDDGWDFYQHVSTEAYPSEIKESWCFGNGPKEYDMTYHPRYETDKDYFERFRKGDKIIIPNLGNGNGFKVGGNKTKHNVVLNNCIAFGNKVKGFDQNNNGGTITIYNCTAYANGRNYGLGNTVSGASIIIKNSLSYKTKDKDAFLSGYTHSHNSWDLSLNITDKDFVSIDTTHATIQRLADGSLPDMNELFRLSSGSLLIDKGTEVGLPYHGKAPDLGAFEYDPNTASVSIPSIQEARVIAYPNPVKTSTTFTITLKEAGSATLSLYNMNGKIVYQATYPDLTAGTHNIHFERGDLPSGVYLYQLSSNGIRTGRHLIIN